MCAQVGVSMVAFITRLRDSELCEAVSGGLSGPRPANFKV